MLAAWLMTFSISLAQLPQEYTVNSDGTRLEMERGGYLQVVSDDTTVSGNGISLYYRVEGVRLVSGEFSDTLFWLAQQPSRAIGSAISSGRRRLFEERTIRLITFSGSHIGGEMTVLSGSTEEGATSFTVYRTWLIDGTPLELESVIQLDGRFEQLVSRLADLPSGSLDQGLIGAGYWLDPQSFLIIDSQPGPLLRLGLPSWDDEGALLVLDIPFDSLNTASGAMLD